MNFKDIIFTDKEVVFMIQKLQKGQYDQVVDVINLITSVVDRNNQGRKNVDPNIIKQPKKE
jgi:hypothetical protein